MKFTKLITIITALFIIFVFSIAAVRKNPRYCDCTSRRATCDSNLKRIGFGLLMYANDNNCWFPPEDNIKGLAKIAIPYLKQTKVLICPTDTKRLAGKKNALKENNSSYIYLDIEHNIAKIRYPSVTVVAFDKPNPHHVNVLFVDGHVAKMKVPKNYSCEAILRSIYKKRLSDPIHQLQLKKAMAMDKKFGWQKTD
jgi:prepilin-type processing-associated H-X9-DG protein